MRLQEKAGQPVVSVENLTVGFDHKNVLESLSLEVRRNEILGIVGGSGSGKSVLMRTIIGLLPRRAGRIVLFGQDTGTTGEIGMRAIDKRWGVLFQHGALFSSLTIMQNIQFQMREELGLSGKLTEEMAVAKLEMVGLDPSDAHKLPAELSGGMTKRAALARAIALDPEFILLDEPTSGLDPISAADLDALIRTLRDTLGLTVFMVTHDLESLFAITDRVAVVADGRIVADGAVTGMAEHDHPWVKTYFGGPRGGLIARRARQK